MAQIQIKTGIKKRLHIVAFDVPYPANYGGVIDIFNRIKSLKEAGIDIILHAFVYNRPESEELLKYCSQVYYYQRHRSLWDFFSTTPFIVKSRKNEKLLQNLLTDNAPILFEGIHCTGFLDHPLLLDRHKLVRIHNIEHEYYFHLAKAEHHVMRKFYNLVESLKLKGYDQILQYATSIVTISPNDYDYYNEQYSNVEYISSSHSTGIMSCQTGEGAYILYHGKLSVPENERAVVYLLKEIFSKSKIPFIIAGMNPGKRLRRIVKKYPNVTLIPNPNEDAMLNLIREAHINLMITFQATGLKLKLLKSLYNGRFCVVNNDMVAGTGLEPLCYIEDEPQRLIKLIDDLMLQSFSEDHIKVRAQNLNEMFDPATNAKKWIYAIWG